MANKKAEQAKKAVAAAKKAKEKAAADKLKKQEASEKKKEKAPRKPRMSSEDYAIIKFGCEALIESEEHKELEFHRSHTVDGVKGDIPVLFHGNYKQLCELLDANEQPTGSVLRTKAIALLERVAPHVTA